ncbi:xylulokinase [Vagococcus elongatus]|uniref:Xylulose kinase n=1 Tax=Vagococcus elongatus TaxID=180344 RepID=A0A430B181_9ENTE|nr:xylulokinase [Vagococcus elongatus]RSU14090.1 xylulokinase [Vagococcus elongatus]
MSYVLGVDLGTSSLKGLVVNKNGEVLFQSSSDYKLYHPQKGHSEQKPRDWIMALENVLKDLIVKCPDLKENLEGLSISGQMHSLVLLDQKGDVLRDAILWNDVRTTKQCQEISERLGDSLLSKTKNIALEGFTLPKILWVMEHEPEIWGKVGTVLLPKDYLSYYLTGKRCTEYSDAAGTLMLNVTEKEWDSDILSEFNISSNQLPELIDSFGEVGTIQQSLLAKFGFKNSVKVFAGGADNACASFGAGIISEDRAMCSIGTSGVFLSYEGVEEKDYHGKLHFFNHVMPKSYYSMGVTLAAGQSLSWFKEIFGGERTFEEILDEAAQSVPGANGLLFVPFIMGERTPYIDGKIRGSFVGIDASHKFSDFARAVIEGITFSLKESQKLMMENTAKIFKEIVSVGGGAKSDLWMQIQADVFETNVRSLKVEQGPGLGAAMIAAMGLEWFNNVETCVATFVTYDQEFYPDNDNVSEYKKYYDIYKMIYSSTRDISYKLADVSK